MAYTEFPTMLVASCPLCGSDKSRPFARTHTGEFVVCNQMCSICGLVFLSPRMTDEALQNFYLAEYRRLSTGSESPTGPMREFEARRAAHLCGLLKTHIPSVGLHIDIGCAAGGLLKRVRAEYGGSAIGIEPSAAYRRHLQGIGIRAWPSLEEYMSSPEAGRKADLVSLSHVLEHLPTPIRTLAYIRDQVLSTDGFLLVEVPNVLVHTAFEPGHLLSFTSVTLASFLAKAGFSVLDMRLHGEPRSDPRPHYITALCRPDRSAKQNWSRPTAQALWILKLRRWYGRSKMSYALASVRSRHGLSKKLLASLLLGLCSGR